MAAPFLCSALFDNHTIEGRKEHLVKYYVSITFTFFFGTSFMEDLLEPLPVPGRYDDRSNRRGGGGFAELYLLRYQVPEPVILSAANNPRVAHRGLIEAHTIKPR